MASFSLKLLRKLLLVTRVLLVTLSNSEAIAIIESLAPLSGGSS